MKLEKPICFLDIESTGLDLLKDRILEIGIIKIFPCGKKEIFESKINPEIEIPLESSIIHGIYKKDIENEPLFREIADDLFEIINGCFIGGFNVIKFDIPMIRESFLRVGKEIEFDEKEVVDVQRIFHLMEKRNLESAYKFYCKKNIKNAHRAIVDTQVTLEIFKAQLEKYSNCEVFDNFGKKIGKITDKLEDISALNLVDKKFLDFSGKIIKKNNNYFFNFGKYKGKDIKVVFKEDAKYYDWIMNNEFTLDTKNKMTKIMKNLI